MYDLNILPKKQNSIWSQYGEWIGCEKKCGYDSKIQYREIIPPVYGGENVHNNVKNEDFYRIEECNKFCRSEEEVLNKWKVFTMCSKSVLPDITKEIKLIEEGEEYENPYYINNLRYVDEDILLKIFELWKSPSMYFFSNSCHGNEIKNDAVILKGTKIYSNGGSSFLEYRQNGIVSLYNIDEKTGEYVLDNKAESIFSTGSVNTESSQYIKIVGSKLQFFNSSNVIIYQVELGGVKPRIIVGELNVMIVDEDGSVMKIHGAIPSFYKVLDTEYYFKNKGNAPIKIISSDDELNYIQITNDTVKLINNNIVIWELLSLINSTVNFSKNGLKVLSNGIVVFEIKASDCNIISLYGINLEFYDNNDYLIAYYGTKMGVLNDGYIIKRPLTKDEENNIDLVNVGEEGGVNRLVFQFDGNLVLYRKNKAIWASKTHGKPSTHLMLKNGEILIMNKEIIVWRSGVVNGNNASTVLILLDGWAYLTVSNNNVESPGFQATRIYPDVWNGWNTDEVKMIVAKYLDDIYDSFPVFSIKQKTHINDLNKAPSKSIIDFTKYLKAIKYEECMPLDLFCKLEKKENKEVLNTFHVNIKTVSNEWKNNISSINTVSGLDISSIDYNTSSTYSYTNNNILGYDSLFKDEYIGNFSSPNVKIETNIGVVVDCQILVKKQREEFVKEYIDNIKYLEYIFMDKPVSRKAISSYFSLDNESFIQLHPDFTMVQNIKSTFSNSIGDDIIEKRLDVLENNCSGGEMLSKKCVDSFKYLKNHNERAKKFYNMNMQLECRKDFNNISCYDYILSEAGSGIVKFVKDYCGNKNNIFKVSCYKICNSSLSSLLDICVSNTNVFILFLFILYIFVFIILRLRKKFTKTNTVKDSKS